jgi:hypothetical protein
MNQAAVDLIARTIPVGLPHPGDDNTPPRVVPLPGFRATGMTDEQAEELIGQAAKTFAEAMVNLLEAEFELMTKADAAQLRQDAADAPDGTRIITLHRNDIATEPVMTITLGKTNQVALPDAVFQALKAAS